MNKKNIFLVIAFLVNMLALYSQAPRPPGPGNGGGGGGGGESASLEGGLLYLIISIIIYSFINFRSIKKSKIKFYKH